MHTTTSMLLSLACLALIAGCGTSRTARGTAPEFAVLDTVQSDSGGHTLDVPRRDGTRRVAVPTRAYEVVVTVRSPGGETLSAPTVTLFEDQAASISVVNQTSFVQTFEVERTHGAWIADPIVGVLQDGLTLDFVVRSAESGDGEIDIAYRSVASNVLDPIPTRSVAFAPDTPRGEIQIPKLVVEEVAGATRLQAGEARWISSSHFGRRGRLSVVVRPAALDLLPTATVSDFADSDDSAMLRSLLAELAARGGRAVPMNVVAYSTPTEFAPGETLHWEDGGFGPYRQLAVSRMVDVPGSYARTVVVESYVRDYAPGRVLPEVQPASAPLAEAFQPEVATIESGFLAQVTPTGRLDVTWAVSPRWSSYGTRLSNGTRVDIDAPVTHVHRASAPLADDGVPDSFVLPVARLAAGGTAMVSAYRGPAAPAADPTR